MFKDKLYLLVYLQEKGFLCDEVETISLREPFEKIFSSTIKILNDKYNFCIDQYQSFICNLMRNYGYMRNYQIPHKKIEKYIIIKNMYI